MNVLIAAMFCRSSEERRGVTCWGLPLLIWGEPGTGKTRLLSRLAKQLGLDAYLRMSPAEQGEGRFGVVPVPGADGYLHYPPPADVAKRFETGRGLLFLDELTCASPALQAPLLGLVQLGMLGGYEFSPHVRIVGATNEVQDAAGGWDPSSGIMNRFGHLDFDGLEAHIWAGALLSNFSNVDDYALVESAAALEDKVIAQWPTAYARAAGLVSGFISRRPDVLHKRPTKGSSDKAWPSRRSCHYATVALASAKIHGLTEQEEDVLLSAFVGAAWVSEFRYWVDNADLPDVADLADKKIKFVHDERRPDRTLAVVGAFAALVIPEKAEKRVDRAVAYYQLIAELAKEVPDYVIAPTKAVLDAKLNVTTLGKSVQVVVSQIFPLMQAAGWVKVQK